MLDKFRATKVLDGIDWLHTCGLIGLWLVVVVVAPFTYEPTSMGTISILAIDPGETSGVVIGYPIGKTDYSNYDFTILYARDIEFETFMPDISYLLGKYRPRYVVMESFNLYPAAAAGQAKIHSRFPSVEVIGMVNALLFSFSRTEAEVIMQPPSSRSRIQILPHHQDRLKGLHHARDAYKHLRYFIVTNKFSSPSISVSEGGDRPRS